VDATAPRALKGLLRSCCHATGVDGAGVSIVTAEGAREPLVATDAIATMIERLQLTLGEGPCVESAATGSAVLVSDLTDRTDPVTRHWPVFRKEATRFGVRALFAFPIEIEAVRLGAVDLYRRSPGPLTQAELGSALACVEGMGVAVLEAPDRYGDMDTPGTLNMVVHQAAGMVMGQLGSSIEEAMVRLRATAFAEDRTVNELALDVVNRRRRLSKETR
jgi:hypothetical protein